LAQAVNTLPNPARGSRIVVTEEEITMADETLETWTRVQQWPEDLQLSLAAKIIGRLAEKPRPPKRTLADLVGILKWEGPPPTDEEVEQILDEERAKKYLK
jgi:1,2-phenylacetyl-CoA epoxidase PaaB subunit